MIKFAMLTVPLAMLLSGIIGLCAVATAQTPIPGSNPVDIVTNSAGGIDFYHMKLELKRDQYVIDQRYDLEKEGFFQVLIPKEQFPIPAPNCRKNIILRMPSLGGTPAIRALYDTLNAGQEPVTVTVELNPYVTVINKKPLKLELQYCNVFFRHKAGDYYDMLH